MPATSATTTIPGDEWPRTRTTTTIPGDEWPNTRTTTTIPGDEWPNTRTTTTIPGDEVPNTWVLHGVVSNGHPGCMGTGAYTRPFSAVDWISKCKSGSNEFWTQENWQNVWKEFDGGEYSKCSGGGNPTPAPPVSPSPAPNPTQTP